MLRFMSFAFALCLTLLLVACSSDPEENLDSANIETPVVIDTAETVADIETEQPELNDPEPVQSVPPKSEPATSQQKPSGLKAESGSSSGLKAEAGKPKPPSPEPTYVTLPAGTPLVVTLLDSIDTDIDSTGDEFSAELSEPIVINGVTVFEAGAPVVGVLTNVIESGRLKTPAELSFTLASIQDADGNWVPVSVDTLAEKKASHTGREVGMIGGGAVIGGVIGKLTKKKGGTLIGAAAGAAAGTAAAAATGKQDIVHPAGETVTFTTRQSSEIALE